MAAFIFISTATRALECRPPFFFPQTAGAPAEAASSHAGAEDARLLCREFNHQIEFATADLVIVAQAAMRFRHQPSDAVYITAGQSNRSLHHALVFRDHMAAAAVDHVGEKPAMLLQ